jgi:poly-gamma-glutamate capsule biosynthesis protein CapA/YwtB (metallophosphatase superfamily)
LIFPTFMQRSNAPLLFVRSFRVVRGLIFLMRPLIKSFLAFASLLLLIHPFGARPEGTVQLALLGDVMLGRDVARAAGQSGQRLPLAALQPDLAGSDLAFANLESPLTGVPAPAGSFDLRAPTGMVAALTSSGLDVVSVANNHALDGGPAGLAGSLAVLDRVHILAVQDSAAAITRQVNGLSVAWLAFDDVTHPLDIPRSLEKIAAASAAADLVVVSVHWGLEYAPAPTQREKILARQWVEAGADLVVGHHPHVLQPAEVITRRDGRTALVLYSLGNAVFDQHSPPETCRSALILVTAGRQGITAWHVVPFRIDPTRGLILPSDEKTAAFVRSRLNLP